MSSAAALTKPPHGAPCNGCGLCCMAELCPLGAEIFRRTKGPCPALEKAEPGYRCGLHTDPARFKAARTRRYGAKRMADAALVLIGSGVGCDAQAEGEPYNPNFGASMRAHYERLQPVLRQAKILWGVTHL